MADDTWGPSDLDGDDDNWNVSQRWEETKIGARLLGSAIRDPAILGELVAAGVDVADFTSHALRSVFAAMRELHRILGRVSETALEQHLEMTLPDPSKARGVVDFCLRSPGVRRGDEVPLLVAHMRERVGRRRLDRLMFVLSREAWGKDTVATMVGRARRELDDIATLSTTSGGADAREIAEIGYALASGSQVFETVPTGFDELDRVLHGGLRVGEPHILIAGTGTGKTTFGIHIARFNARRGIGVDYVTLESKRDVLSGVLSMQEAGWRFPLKLESPPRAWSDVQVARGTIAAWNLCIDDRKPLTAEAIMANIRARKRDRAARGQSPTKLVVVDYAQRIQRSSSYGRDDLNIAHTSEVLRQGCEDEDIAMLLLSQVAGDPVDAKGKKRRVNAEDTAGGKQLAKDAGAVLIIERDRGAADEKKRNTTSVRLDKNRHFGDAAECWVRWSKTTTQLTPCTKDGEELDAAPPAQAEIDDLFPEKDDDKTEQTFAIPEHRERAQLTLVHDADADDAGDGGDT